MADTEHGDLLKFVGKFEKHVYEAVKAGDIADLSPEAQPLAKAISEHMHLKHVHNALEFADLREGEAYEITVNGNVVNPLAHVTMHAAVKGQIEADPLVGAAFEKMVASGTSVHHAEHILAALFAELYFGLCKAADVGDDGEKTRAAYYRKIKKITGDPGYRKKLARQLPADHFVFE